MKTKTPRLIALALLPILTACGSSHSSKSDPAPQLREPPRVQSITSGVALTSSSDDKNLLGDWTSKCETSDGRSSSNLQLSFKDNHLIQTLNLYLDSVCGAVALKLNILMSYQAQAKTIDFLSQRATTVIKDYDLAQAASQGNSCGYNHWLTGVEYDITNKSCPKSQNGLHFTGNESGKRARGTYTITANQLNLDGVILNRATSSSLRDNVQWSQKPAALFNGATAGFSPQ